MSWHCTSVCRSSLCSRVVWDGDGRHPDSIRYVCNRRRHHCNSPSCSRTCVGVCSTGFSVAVETALAWPNSSQLLEKNAYHNYCISTLHAECFTILISHSDVVLDSAQGIMHRGRFIRSSPRSCPALNYKVSVLLPDQQSGIRRLIISEIQPLTPNNVGGT